MTIFFNDSVGSRYTTTSEAPALSIAWPPLTSGSVTVWRRNGVAQRIEIGREVGVVDEAFASPVAVHVEFLR